MNHRTSTNYCSIFFYINACNEFLQKLIAHTVRDIVLNLLEHTKDISMFANKFGSGWYRYLESSACFIYEGPFILALYGKGEWEQLS